MAKNTSGARLRSSERNRAATPQGHYWPRYETIGSPRRRGGFIGWRKIVDQLRNGDYGIMDAVCNDWFVALDDIGAERASDFSVSKLDQIIDARLGKWTVITCNFTREEIAEHMDVRIASRLGRANDVIVDNISVLDYSIRSKEVA